MRDILTKDEQCYSVEVINREMDSCGDIQACKEEVSANYFAVMNYRRDLRSAVRSQIVFDKLRRPCDQLPNLFEQRICFKEVSTLDFEDAMARAGYIKAGVNAEGYQQLRIGMDLAEVEYVLGGPGEEVSYASMRGYSTVIYRWSRATRSILVTISDDKLSARTQFGL